MKNNRTHDQNMEQLNDPLTLQSSSQNLGMQKPKNEINSSVGRAMLEKCFLYFGREPQIGPAWNKTTSSPTHDDL